MKKPQTPAEKELARLQTISIHKRGGYASRYRDDPQLGKIIEARDSEGSLSDEVLNDYFLYDLRAIELCIGDDLIRSYFNGDYQQTESVPHLAFSLHVALKAISLMDCEQRNRWWAWAGTTRLGIDHTMSADDQALALLELKRDWLRTLFRATLCLPLGYMVSDTLIRSPEAPHTWLPAVENLPDYESEYGASKVEATNRYISPKEVSHGTYRRLFGSAPNKGGLPSAEYDFWADRPNRDNPLYANLKRALTHAFRSHMGSALPYWWVLTMNHFFISDENYVPIQCRIEPGHGPTSVQEGESSEPQSVSDTTHPKLAILLPWVAESFQDKTFLVNQSGALLHQYDGNLYLVYPAFFRKLSEHKPSLYPDHELLEAHFVEAGFVYSDTPTGFGIHPRDNPFGKRLGKMVGLRLSDKGINALFPNGVDFEDNPQLKITNNQPAAIAIN